MASDQPSADGEGSDGGTNRAGLEAARRQGRTGGRKRKMTDSKIAVAKRLLQDGVSAREVAVNLGVSIPTLYRWLPASERYISFDYT